MRITFLKYLCRCEENINWDDWGIRNEMDLMMNYLRDINMISMIVRIMMAILISGIGFLGAGTIMVTGKTQIKGLTTAAGQPKCWIS